MFRDALKAKKECRYTELVHSPVFHELTQLINQRVTSQAEDSYLNILDLGKAHPGSVSFFNQFDCSYQIVDCYPILSECKQLKSETTEEFQARVFRLFKDIVPLSKDRKLDLILSWDGLNYLERQVIELFSLYLSKYCNRGSFLHAYIYSHQAIPKSWGRFDILSDEHILSEYDDEQTKLGPAFNQTDVNQIISRFTIRKSILLRSGIQEYLLNQDEYS